jgi:single-strand selective monofunctional uracil DNA glycosylase
MEPVEKSCRESLARIIEILQPKKLIGVGAFAEKQLASIKDDQHQLGKILHPSPASPAANRDFAGTVTRQLIELEIIDGS